MANISVSFIFFGFPIPFFFHFVVVVPPFLLLFLSSRRTWTAWSNKDSDGQFFFLWGGRSFFQSLHFQPSDTLCVQGGPIISHPATTNFSNLCLSSFGRVCISFSVQVKARCPDFSLFPISFTPLDYQKILFFPRCGWGEACHKWHSDGSICRWCKSSAWMQMSPQNNHYASCLCRCVLRETTNTELGLYFLNINF